MAQQKIPITFIAIPAPPGIEALNFNQLTTLLAQYLSGSIQADVSFFLEGDTLPTTDQGVIFYNTSTGLFYAWSTMDDGAYVVTGITTEIGDVKFNYVNDDQLSTGWVLALGSRTIDSVTALAANQAANLHGLFGPDADVQIPNITAPVSAIGGGSGTGDTLYPKIFCGYPIA